MARRPSAKPRPERRATAPASPPPPAGDAPSPPSETFWTRPRLILAVASLLIVQLALAVQSLVLENPTIDEVIHLPAGISYWETGTFRLYHHNPPLVRLIAALPVLGHAKLDYQSPAWKAEPPNKAVVAHEFMARNAANYFEDFTRARLLMPLFAVLGGVVVFAWSRSLYGPGGGLLSLVLWTFCPNILAHARLITTDMGATAIGALATYLFWRYLRRPSWAAAALAGLALGLGQVTKFSLIIFFGLWPLLALIRYATSAEYRATSWRILGHAAAVVGLSVLVIDVGYAFEGVGTPLGRFEFVCQTFTKPATAGMRRPQVEDPLRNGAYRYRVNRLRDTWLGAIPSPLPSEYLLGFDDQKLEAEGIPRKFFDARITGPDGERVDGYPVYLNGKLAQKSWWYYYLLTLVYKVPEGTGLLLLVSLAVLAASPRSRAPGFDELAVLLVPAFVLFVMSVFTNINLGLRYVLPIFPFLYISAGKLAQWSAGLPIGRARRVGQGVVIAGLALTAAACLSIHPHYLAYFNRVSGGPERGAEHLIDSNIDWGQDLVPLRKWLAANAPGETVGLAYFGQIHPRIFDERGQGFDWFLPPPTPDSVRDRDGGFNLPTRYRNPANWKLRPGLYAVGATLVEGLPWRVYDMPVNVLESARWLPWQVWMNGFGYFRELTPIAKVGYSIWIYRVTPEQAERINDFYFSDDVIGR